MALNRSVHLLNCSIHFQDANEAKLMTLSLNNLLVSRFEITLVIATSLNCMGHCRSTMQHSIKHAHVLSGGFPAQYLLLHNRTIGGKVHTVKSNVEDEIVALLTVE